MSILLEMRQEREREREMKKDSWREWGPPSSRQSLSPPGPMPPFAMAISTLWVGEFLIAASKRATWSSQSRTS
jgi:hypothetical protein